MLEESTNIRGWLLKNDGITTKWRKRFFVIQNDQIVYYKSLRDSQPSKIFLLTKGSKVVDYGTNGEYHQFSLYENDQRVLWLAAEDNKARYWISVMRTEIERHKDSVGYDKENGSDEIVDFVLPPLSVSGEENPSLRNSIESTTVPSCMEDIYSLLHCTALDSSLLACQNGCLYFKVNHNSSDKLSYHMATMSIPMDIEYVAYFLVDCCYARSLWDPLFFSGEEIDHMNKNNSIFHLTYKPFNIVEYPCTVKCCPRDFCVYRHYDYDADTNSYTVFFSSTTHPDCPEYPSFVRGYMNMGYKIEAINSSSTRITLIYSINPMGYLQYLQLCLNQFESYFTMSLPGLRDMLSQIPEYHIFNLIERILKGVKHVVSVSSGDHMASKDGEGSPSSEKKEDEKDDSEGDVVIPKFAYSLYLTNSVPHASECEVMDHCWEEADGSNWNVRSKTYATSKIKERSSPSFCRLLCVDVLKASQPISHVVQYEGAAFDHLLSLDLSNISFVLVINLQIANSISIVSYYGVPKTVSEDYKEAYALLNTFRKESSAFRNARMKILPHIVEGGYFIKKAVGTTPCIIGTKGETAYFEGSSPFPYLECDFDMDGSSFARSLSKYLFSSAGDLVVEMAFVIQGDKVEELPERVLGGFRFYHLKIDKAKMVDTKK